MRELVIPQKPNNIISPSELMADATNTTEMRLLCRQISNISQDSFDMLYNELTLVELYRRMIEVSAINEVMSNK